MATSAILAGSAKAVPALPNLPIIPVNISGVVTYQGGSATKGDITKTSTQNRSFNNKTLIRLLNESSAATNTLVDVTGVSQIPAGSSILFDIDDETLIITNKNGFSFPLSGTDPITQNSYNYGYLDFDNDVLFGSASLNNATGAGSEKDYTGVEFYFYSDGSGSGSVELEPEYGNGSLAWIFGATTSGHQTARVKFKASPAGYYAYVDGNEGITTACDISGRGKATIYSLGEPFYNWW